MIAPFDIKYYRLRRKSISGRSRHCTISRSKRKLPFAFGAWVLHLVVAGQAHLVRHRADGRTLVLQRARPNTVLAEASVFSERYHCDCMAVMPTRTLAVARAAVRTHLTQDSGFAEAFASHLAHELQATRLRAEVLSLRTVRERLDAWLAWHGDELPSRGNWITVANEIGTSPEALYRELARRRRSRSATRASMFGPT